MSRRAFTLIEIFVVLCILSILAAIAIPVFHGHSTRGKDAAARDVLRVMRTQIELYRFEHGGLKPGYMNGVQATTTVLTNQFIGTSSVTGLANASRTPAGAYIYGPYCQKMPVNPFNGLSTIKYVPSATLFSAVATETTGWLYKKETAEFRLNKSGTDSAGVAYTDY
jgi:general secretion pathway protein G